MFEHLTMKTRFRLNSQKHRALPLTTTTTTEEEEERTSQMEEERVGGMKSWASLASSSSLSPSFHPSRHLPLLSSFCENICERAAVGEMRRDGSVIHVLFEGLR
ncbi:hypothetical protein JTE90_027039 [Oedothorax gibbosus]|uniref:Uncharacterized protein n=1 Tax=Oedothorax gibbosus TaxID=931172 RepID=A0AAV6UUZ8_9ARAC|nr:hypothetical protein JTE90_027039 [Oedothorax gibbosus]